MYGLYQEGHTIAPFEIHFDFFLTIYRVYVHIRTYKNM